MNRPLTCSLISFTLLSLALHGCDSDSTPTNEPATVDVATSSLTRDAQPQVTAPDRATFASDNRAFALAAYRQLTTENDNLVFSPASISIALAMAYAGAAGPTASEMATALHFSLPPERLHPAMNALDLDLATRGEGKLGADGGPMRLHVVNAAWAERTGTFESAYLDVLGTHYGAGIRLLDFVNAPEPSRLTINDWVATQTEQRIKDLLPPMSIDSLTRLVLTNAVYFNAAWLAPFDPDKTRDGSFTALDGSAVTTKLMSGEFSIPAAQAAGYTAFSLPYQDERLSLLVVVPDSGTFATFEAAFDPAKLADIEASLGSQQVILAMPRFRVETSAGLVKTLQQLGMQAPFQAGVADFSGIDGRQDLFIANVLHKAFIDVAEKGTEAAAATAVVLGVKGALPTGLRINVDRPFLYVVRDQPTGAVLFMGRVVDPSK